MKQLIIIILLSFPAICFAQEVVYVLPDDSTTNTELTPPDHMPIHFFQGSLEGALQKAKRERKLLFVDFYADWCKPCKMIEHEVFQDAEFYEYINKHYVAYKLYSDNFANGGFDYSEKMGVKELPTLMVLNSKGEEMGRVVGYNTAYTYLLELKRIERFSAYRR